MKLAKNRQILIIVILFLVLLALPFAFLAVRKLLEGTNRGVVQIDYYDGISEDGSYNSNLFYRNDLQVHFAADPGVTYVSEEQDPEYGGYYYMYYTEREFPCFRSRDLNNWEYMGTTLSMPNNTYIDINGSYWAPEVYYNADEELYYMYYSTTSKVGNAGTEYSSSTNKTSDRLYIGFATSETPVGPFVQWTGTNADGLVVTADMPPMNFTKRLNLEHEFSSFDFTLFQDTDGQLYGYLVRSGNSWNTSQEIWGLKMKDWVTPDYSTMTQIVVPGYKSVTSHRTMEDVLIKKVPNEEKTSEIYKPEYGVTMINEAPFMIEHEGKYYLTYSPFELRNRDYAVWCAVSDSPLGIYEKVDPDDGNPVVGVDGYMDHMGATGHHCFIWAGDELFSVYHAHCNRATGEDNPRAIAIDRVHFIENEKLGFDMLYCNGPTYSLQPLASSIYGYENLALKAKVEATNIKDNSDTKLLNDYLFVTHEYAREKEFLIDDSTEITLTFDEPVEVSAVMVYNSFDYKLAIEKIDSIVFETVEKPEGYTGDNFKGEVGVFDIEYNPDYVNFKEKFMRPGGSFLAEFAPMKVKEITIRISDKFDDTTDTIAIGDIVVLGKEIN